MSLSRGIMKSLSPKTKICAYIGMILLLFFTSSLYLYLGILLFILILLLNIPISTIKKGCIPIILFVLFTFIGNILFYPGRIIYSIGPLSISYEGLDRASILSLRVLIMILGAKLLTATTPIQDIIDALGKFLLPLERLRIPAREFVLIMGLTIKYLPRIYKESEELYRDAIKDYRPDGIVARLSFSAGLLSELFIKSLLKAENSEGEDIGL